MDWEAISEEKLLEAIEAAEFAMEPRVLAFWSRIRIRPMKWQLPPWGDLGGGFWVVAVIGQQCIWFNDIEDGFNISPFAEFGTIGDYRCNQSELQHCVLCYAEEFLRQVGASGEADEIRKRLVSGTEIRWEYGTEDRT